MPYSDIVLDHFRAPRNMRVMQRPDAVGVAGEPGRGNFMVIYLRVEGDRIVEASFQTHGCCPSIAAGSWVTERIRGHTAPEVIHWTEDAIDQELGGLPMHKRKRSAPYFSGSREGFGSPERSERMVSLRNSMTLRP